MPQSGEFHPTAKQAEAGAVLASEATHIMLAGGSGSGKTFMLLLALITRALKAPGSRHLVVRFRFNACKQTIVFQTLRDVMRLCFPSIPCEVNKSDWFLPLPGGSEVWFGGLDDKERTEKILGSEYATIYLNECSQIPWASRNMAITRLRQRVMDQFGKELPVRAYYDENPPDKGHWSYKLFRTHMDPDTHSALRDPESYAYLQMNPADNRENLSASYIKTLEALPGRYRMRFLEGEFRDANPDALFTDEVIDRWRLTNQELPEMLRIVVAVDPSGADDNEMSEHDAIGIVVCGLGTDGNGYVLEDLTCKVGPAKWGSIAVQAYERWSADRIVYEDNFGGAMVKQVIQAARPRTPTRAVHASRGKVVRAEPISALMETGKVRMAGNFRELEEELYAFTTHGYTGDRSPNRADAMVWGMADLFPELTSAREIPRVAPVAAVPPVYRSSPNAWMRNL